MNLTISKHFLDWPENQGSIKEAFLKHLNLKFYIFSDALKAYRLEWLEWNPNDVIYLEQEIQTIKDYGYSDELFIKTYKRKQGELQCLR